MRKKILNNWSLKLLSVVVAVIAWLVIVNYDNPNTTRLISGIPIDVVGTETLTANNQIYQVVGNQTASVRVRCPRRLAQSLRVADFRATADFSQLYSPTNQIPIVITSTNTRVLDSYITQITQSLEVVIENIVSRQMDVGVNVTGEPMEGYQVGSVTPSPSVVVVRAPESIMDQISRIGISVGVDTLSQDATQHAKLICYNAGGNVMDTTGMDNLKFSSTDIVVAVQIMNVKNVSISAKVSGQEETAKGYRYTGMEISPETVKISGRRYVLEQITSLNLSAGDLDVTGASADVEKIYQLGDLQLPEGVTLVDSQEDAVTVKLNVEKLETETFELELSRVNIRNLDESLFIENEDAKLSVTVEGLASDLAALEASEISGTADLSGLGAGVHNITAEVEVPAGFSVVGTAAMRLQLTDRSTTQAQPDENVPEGAEHVEGQTESAEEAATPGPEQAADNEGAAGVAQDLQPETEKQQMPDATDSGEDLY